MYLLGIDLGSSSIKVALIEAKSQHAIKVMQYPATEMPITSAQEGWAEQDPEQWWSNLKHTYQALLVGIDILEKAYAL